VYERRNKLWPVLLQLLAATGEWAAALGVFRAMQVGRAAGLAGCLASPFWVSMPWRSTKSQPAAVLCLLTVHGKPADSKTLGM
jgi:hypothetical protein